MSIFFFKNTHVVPWSFLGSHNKFLDEYHKETFQGVEIFCEIS